MRVPATLRELRGVTTIDEYRPGADEIEGGTASPGRSKRKESDIDGPRNPGPAWWS
jgi:hypothetical protein